jgi:hypothetical protein
LAKQKPVAPDARAARDADGRQKKSARRRSIDAAVPRPSRRDCGGVSPPLKLNLCFSVGMGDMIGPEAPRRKALR